MAATVLVKYAINFPTAVNYFIPTKDFVWIFLPDQSDFLKTVWGVVSLRIEVIIFFPCKDLPQLAFF